MQADLIQVHIKIMNKFMLKLLYYYTDVILPPTSRLKSFISSLICIFIVTLSLSSFNLREFLLARRFDS